jgi:hypothetical protein
VPVAVVKEVWILGGAEMQKRDGRYSTGVQYCFQWLTLMKENHPQLWAMLEVMDGAKAYVEAKEIEAEKEA